MPHIKSIKSLGSRAYDKTTIFNYGAVLGEQWKVKEKLPKKERFEHVLLEEMIAGTESCCNYQYSSPSL
jgi:hypothetical protein